MKALTAFITTIVPILVLISGQADLPTKIEKKIEREIRTNYPDISIEKVLVDTLEYNISSNNGYMFNAFFLEHNKKKIGTLFFTQAMGRYNLFDFLVIFDKESIIKKIKILNYRSPHGGEISSRGFIKQFENKPENENFSYGKEINGISGATISGKAITNEINRLFKIVKRLNKK
ncbi:FMN-binding protein [Bacteroidota bacterium]